MIPTIIVLLVVLGNNDWSFEKKADEGLIDLEVTVRTYQPEVMAGDSIDNGTDAAEVTENDD